MQDIQVVPGKVHLLQGLLQLKQVAPLKYYPSKQLLTQLFPTNEYPETQLEQLIDVPEQAIHPAKQSKQELPLKYLPVGQVIGKQTNPPRAYPTIQDSQRSFAIEQAKLNIFKAI